jgi:hypothetical protein
MTKPIATVAIRNSDLAKIHIAKKALEGRMSDDEYRGLLMTLCQVDSSAKLDMAGRRRFLEHLTKLMQVYGVAPAMKGNQVRTKLPPKAAKIYSLWQQLYTAQLVRERSFQALEAWVKAQTGVDKLKWLNDAQAGQCIEQLKAWLVRKAP